MENQVEGNGSVPGNAYPQLIQKIRQLWMRISYPEELILIGSAILVGTVTGFGAILFILLLRQINTFVQWVNLQFGTIGMLAIMTFAGFVVGFIIDRWAHEAKGHGVPEVMEAVALRGGRIRARVAAMKVLASSITIGAGGSAGREGPIVQVGSALGSTLGQWLRFPDERIRTLVACGAAAGIAATFNAPIAGSIFCARGDFGAHECAPFWSHCTECCFGQHCQPLLVGRSACFSGACVSVAQSG